MFVQDASGTGGIYVGGAMSMSSCGSGNSYTPQNKKTRNKDRNYSQDDNYFIDVSAKGSERNSFHGNSIDPARNSSILMVDKIIPEVESDETEQCDGDVNRMYVNSPR